jgi:hypothetical protein
MHCRPASRADRADDRPLSRATKADLFASDKMRRRRARDASWNFRAQRCGGVVAFNRNALPIKRFSSARRGAPPPAHRRKSRIFCGRPRGRGVW